MGLKIIRNHNCSNFFSTDVIHFNGKRKLQTRGYFCIPPLFALCLDLVSADEIDWKGYMTKHKTFGRRLIPLSICCLGMSLAGPVEVTFGGQVKVSKSQKAIHGVLDSEILPERVG